MRYYIKYTNQENIEPKISVYKKGRKKKKCSERAVNILKRKEKQYTACKFCSLKANWNPSWGLLTECHIHAFGAQTFMNIQRVPPRYLSRKQSAGIA